MYSKKYLILIIPVLLITILFQSCDNNSNPLVPVNPTGMVSYGSQFATGSKAKVEIFAVDSFKVGYNKVYIKLTDSATGTIITDAHVNLMPTVTSSGTTSGAPFQSPQGENPTYENMYEGYIIFTSDTHHDHDDSWSLRVYVHNHMPVPALGGEANFINLPIHSNSGKYKTTIGPNGDTHYWAYIDPKTPIVGMNNFEFLVFRKQGSFSFPTVDSLSVVSKPWMESMGHGSPNNENPVYQSKGLYKGKLNFTMSGDWRIYLNTTNNLNQKDSTHFDIVF